MSRTRSVKGAKSILVQCAAGGVDTSIQNYLIYYGGILQFGTMQGYLYAACIGGFFNLAICFILKFLWVYDNNGQVGETLQAYTRLRLYLAVIGSGITYLPVLLGGPFFISSWCSFLFSIIVLVWKSPKIFEK